MVNAPAKPNRPLDILISGAGIGGLATGIALRRAGHNVQIFERSSFNNEYGAAVSITPNANCLLRGIGLALEDIGGVKTKKFDEYSSTGEVIRSTDTAGLTTIYKAPWQYIHRVDLHNGLKELAAGEGKGNPCKINLGCRTISVDVEKGSLTLADGTTYYGDMVVAADGVNSALRPFIDHSGNQPAPFGMSCYRFLIQATVLEADPQTRRFLENGFEIWSGEGKKIVYYICRHGEFMNCVIFVPDENSEDKQTWSGPALKADMLEQFKDFHPDALALLHKAEPDGVKYWQLFDMKTLDTWTNGKAVIMGDAAHPFLPFIGQGAAQAIEDGITLAAVVPLDRTTPEDVPERLKIYQKARFARVERIQNVSRVSGKETEEDLVKSNQLLKAMRVNFSHDARVCAEELLEQHLSGNHIEGYQIENTANQR